MRRRDYLSLVRRAAVAYNLGSFEHQRIMDNAAATVDDWDTFVADVEEEYKVPPTSRERARYNRLRREFDIMEIRNMQKTLEQRILDLVGRST